MFHFISAKEGTSSSLCGNCLKFLDGSSFVDALSLKGDLPSTAVVRLKKSLNDMVKTAGECEICRLILSNADEFEDDSPMIKMEFVFGSREYDIKRIHLVYESPVSEELGLATGHNIILRRYLVHTLCGRSILNG